MILLACSTLDPASENAARYLISEFGMEDCGNGSYRLGNISLELLSTSLTFADSLDGRACELIIFISRHSSAAGIPSLTVHAEGNWGDYAELGGRPRTLSVAAPSAMLCALREFNAIETKMEKTYEATHHGPALRTPSMFIEIGGNERVVHDKSLASELGRVALSVAESAAEGSINSSAVALGIGGTHYPRKFTSMALSKGYAFSHIMPKHALSNPDGTANLDMAVQAAERSGAMPSIAVIDWKSMNSQKRASFIKALAGIGIDYEKA